MLLLICSIPIVLFELVAVYDSLSPLSDEEIRASMVDTWHPAAMLASLALIYILMATLLLITSLIAAPQARPLAVVLLAVCAITATHITVNHIRLTERTSQLWDMEFGGFYGLF